MFYAQHNRKNMGLFGVVRNFLNIELFWPRMCVKINGSVRLKKDGKYSVFESNTLFLCLYLLEPYSKSNHSFDRVIL